MYARFSRTRDIEDSKGACLRVSMSAHADGATVTLERRDQPHRPSARLSLCGTEILSGFIMSARLSAPHAMPDEATDRPLPTRFRLDCSRELRVVIEQDEAFPVAIEARLWDRLYAELCLVIAHGRAQNEAGARYNPVGVLH